MASQAAIKQNELQTWMLMKLLSQKNTFNQNAGWWRNLQGRTPAPKRFVCVILTNGSSQKPWSPETAVRDTTEWQVTDPGLHTE